MTLLKTPPLLRLLVGLALCAISPTPVDAQTLHDTGPVPHLDESGQAGFNQFSMESEHKAFVIAPGGMWAWRSGMQNETEAFEQAMSHCREKTAQTCVPYAINDQIVFDETAWAQLLRPYATAEQAKKLPVAPYQGERFPNITFKTANGTKTDMHAMKGKVVFLHFWGSWCAPCLHELPAIAALYDKYKDNSDVRFVLLQVREPFARAKRFLNKQNIDLPLHDSGHQQGTSEFQLADGTTIGNRDLAPLFPSTYIIDRHGVVAFRQAGAFSLWLQFEPFLNDILTNSGK